MSLLTSVASGSVGTKYYIENIGGEGDQPLNAVPCIKTGDLFGAIRISDPGAGLVIVGGGIGNTPLVGGIRGGGAAGTSVTLGSSTASQTNIVLTDGLVTFNADVVLSGAGSDLSVGGDINLVNGQSAGKSISGYFSGVTTLVVPNTGVGQAVANPADITAGLYAITTDFTTGGNEAIQVATVAYWTGAVWQGGSTLSANTLCVLAPGAGGAAMSIAQSGGGAVTANVRFRKLLN
jgi:hypothetical protein